MTNPATAAMLHQNAAELPKQTSLLHWHHWTVSTPPLGRRLVITNEVNLFMAKVSPSEPKMWETELFALPFDKYPLWSEEPKFAQTAKKVEIVSNGIK